MPETGLNDADFEILRQRSNSKGLAQLAAHIAVLGGTAVLLFAAHGTFWLLPALWLHGVVLVFLFAALHETIHRSAFRSCRLNDGVARVCGMLLMLPPGYFRAFHAAHHRHTQNSDRDPELAIPKPATFRAYLWQVSGFPYWGERIHTTLRHALGDVDEPFLRRHQQPKIIQEARIILFVYAGVAIVSVTLQSWVAVWYWLIPALLGQPALRLFLLAEHTACPSASNMLENSRTTISVWPLRQLAWNMPYHAEHHAYPALPFHALPKAHALLKVRIAVQAPGYVAVHRVFIMRLLQGQVLGSVDISLSPLLRLKKR